MSTLPPAFADLEPFTDWAVPGEGARYAKRLASTMTEIQAFYDAAFPRLAAGRAHLDGFPLDALPEPETRLLWLFSGLITASFPVECWRQARVPDSGAAAVEAVLEPAV